VQKQNANCAANHDVNEAVDSMSTELLAKAFCSSTVVGGISASWAPENGAISAAVIGSPTSLKGESEFQLRGERFGARIIET
jgi:hypothetical protein